MSLRLSTVLLEKVDDLAEKRGVSRNQLILNAMADYLEGEGEKRYLQATVTGDTISIWDGLLNQIVELRMIGGKSKKLFCSVDRTEGCKHIKWAHKTLDEVKERVRKGELDKR